MTPWFRFYSEVLNDPKVQKLDGETFKDWVNLLCVASMNGGKLPGMDDLAFAMRRSSHACSTLVSRLLDAGLLDARQGGVHGVHYAPHGWDKRQFGRDGDFRLTAEWRQMREIVFQRDDFTCAYCGERGGKLQCDHIVPVACGGKHDFSNLTTACARCNQSKRDKLVSEWVQ